MNSKVNVKSVTEKEEIVLEFYEDDNDSPSIITMSENEAMRIFGKIAELIKCAKEKREHWDLIAKIYDNDFSELYDGYVSLYAKDDEKMTPCAAFSKALNEGMIDSETYLAIRYHYGNQWDKLA